MGITSLYKILYICRGREIQKIFLSLTLPLNTVVSMSDCRIYDGKYFESLNTGKSTVHGDDASLQDLNFQNMIIAFQLIVYDHTYLRDVNDDQAGR